jgi:hypothetical protein
MRETLLEFSPHTMDFEETNPDKQNSGDIRKYIVTVIGYTQLIWQWLKRGVVVFEFLMMSHKSGLREMLTIK